MKNQFLRKMSCLVDYMKTGDSESILNRLYDSQPVFLWLSILPPLGLSKSSISACTLLRSPKSFPCTSAPCSCSAPDTVGSYSSRLRTCPETRAVSRSSLPLPFPAILKHHVNQFQLLYKLFASLPNVLGQFFFDEFIADTENCFSLITVCWNFEKSNIWGAYSTNWL